MGNCFSFTTRRGRKKVRVGIGQKSFQTDGKSSGTSTTRRSVSIYSATDEFEAEAASGLISFGDSDISRAGLGPADEVVRSSQPQRFEALMAQEARREYLDRRKPRSTDSPGRPPVMPSTKMYADQGHMENSFGRKERMPGSPSIIDLMNIKGRRELETARGYSPLNSKSGLKKVTARNDSFNRGGGQKFPEHYPVDFGFLTEKSVADNSKDGRQLSQAHPHGEPSARTNQEEPADDEARSSSVSDFDEFTKSYRESAARAAARDRDNFMNMSSSKSNDVPMSGPLIGSSPGFRPRNKSISRVSSGSKLAEFEQEIVPAPVTFGELAEFDSKLPKAASPSIPRGPGAVTTTNVSFPPSHRGMHARRGSHMANLV